MMREINKRYRELKRKERIEGLTLEEKKELKRIKLTRYLVDEYL